MSSNLAPTPPAVPAPDAKPARGPYKLYRVPSLHTWGVRLGGHPVATGLSKGTAESARDIANTAYAAGQKDANADLLAACERTVDTLGCLNPIDCGVPIRGNPWYCNNCGLLHVVRAAIAKAGAA